MSLITLLRVVSILNVHVFICPVICLSILSETFNKDFIIIIIIYYSYSDDTQLYISIKPINQRVVDEGVAKFENCITDIYTWMSQNKLKLNADKTEVLVMGTPQMRAKNLHS